MISFSTSIVFNITFICFLLKDSAILQRALLLIKRWSVFKHLKHLPFFLILVIKDYEYLYSRGLTIFSPMNVFRWLKLKETINLNLFLNSFLVFAWLLTILKSKSSLRIYVIYSRKEINVCFEVLYWRRVESKCWKLNILKVSMNCNEAMIALKRA